MVVTRLLVMMVVVEVDGHGGNHSIGDDGGHGGRWSWW